MAVAGAERPCRVLKHAYANSADTSLAVRWLYLNSPSLPLRHIEACFRGLYNPVLVPADQLHLYNHLLYWANGIPAEVPPFINLLTQRLMLPTENSPLDLALALDWYKIPDDGDSGNWSNTESGGLVNKMKYYIYSPNVRKSAASQLVTLLVDTINRHPALNSAKCVVSVPGSKGDGKSVGEWLAASVAEATGKRLVRTNGPARASRKENRGYSLDGLFTITEKLSHPCVIVDDVIRSGATAEAVAAVAKMAGASRVYGLAGAKTMRS